MHYMIECQSGKDEGGVRRRLIVALRRNEEHENSRWAWALQVASSRKTMGSKQANTSGSGAPRVWRTHPPRWRSCVENIDGGEIALKHVEQGSIGTRRWQGRLSHIAQGKVAINGISSLIMKRKDQMFHCPAFMCFYVTED